MKPKKQNALTRLTPEGMAKDLYAGFRLSELTQIVSDVFEGLVMDMYGHFDKARYGYAERDKMIIMRGIKMAKQAANIFHSVNSYIYKHAENEEKNMLMDFSDHINDMLLPFYPFGAQDPKKVEEYKRSFCDCMDLLVERNPVEDEQYAELHRRTFEAFKRLGKV